ncbi:MAG: hypothetical protein ACSHWZ_02205 [Sulfitobacter sp.]
MIAAAPRDFAAALAAIPFGTTQGRAQMRRYITNKTAFNAGRSVKLVAEELGGTDYISLNFYDLSKGAKLAPCEMPAAKVIAFVQTYQADG